QKAACAALPAHASDSRVRILCVPDGHRILPVPRLHAETGAEDVLQIRRCRVVPEADDVERPGLAVPQVVHGLRMRDGPLRLTGPVYCQLYRIVTQFFWLYSFRYFPVTNT